MTSWHLCLLSASHPLLLYKFGTSLCYCRISTKKTSICPKVTRPGSNQVNNGPRLTIVLVSLRVDAAACGCRCWWRRQWRRQQRRQRWRRQQGQRRQPRWHTDNNQLKETDNQLQETQHSTTSCRGRNIGGSGNVDSNGNDNGDGWWQQWRRQAGDRQPSVGQASGGWRRRKWE